IPRLQARQRHAAFGARALLLRGACLRWLRWRSARRDPGRKRAAEVIEHQITTSPCVTSAGPETRARKRSMFAITRATNGSMRFLALALSGLRAPDGS